MLIVKLDYNKCGYHLEHLSEEARKVMWEMWPFVKLNNPKFEDWKPGWMSVDRKITVDLATAYAFQTAGIPIELEGVEGTMLTKMQDSGAWSRNQAVMPHDIKDGAAVQITIPDMALLFIDEVDWIDDACTQELQERLNKGWRILAVCPPNAQRRPDYILGRRKQIGE